MASLLPAKVLSPNKTEVDSSSLNGKVLGLYFSAHWCPPCRGFTPELVKWFNNFKANHPSKDQFEIVFVSSDKDQHSFDEYFGEMKGFHAVPFSNRAAKDELSKKFGVRGIPTFVIVDADAQLMTKDGRSVVGADPKGEEFPWKPKTFAEIFGQDFIGKDGAKVSRADFAGQYFGIYFSAHWCGPCRHFTPDLIKVYNKVNAQGKKFEIVFASSDRDEASFKEYYGSMPWLAVPFADRKRKEQLSTLFEVEGIPTLVILDKDGNVVNKDGRAAISADPAGENFPWKPKALNPLTEELLGGVNESAALIALDDGKNEDAIKAILQPLADQEEAKPSIELLFFYEPSEDSAAPQLRGFLNLPKGPQLIILDIPNQRRFVAPKAEFTAENINEFVTAFRQNKLSAQGIKG